MDRYEELRRRLDQHPSGAPASAAFAEILHLLFRPEEVEVALGMTFMPQPAEAIAATSGVPAGEVRQRCEEMAERGVVFARTKKGIAGYALLPTIPGIFEYPFLKDGDPELRRRLGQLWQEYHRDGLSDSFAGKPTPLARVIPVHTSVDTRTEVLPFDVIPTMLARAETIALARCACRESLAGCERPREVCLFFDSTARALVERSFAREVGLAEAVAVVRDAEEAGLVHTTTNASDRLTFLCNCCPCCCTILRGLTELDNPRSFAVSRWVAAVDGEVCTGCGTCADERCPVGAVAVVDETAKVTGERCIGCGLCTTTCPSGAMAMARRDGVPETPATVAEMTLTIVTEKGKIEGFRALTRRS